MPEYLSPGGYIEEVPTGPGPIERVSTSTTGMAGPTERGPDTGAHLVTSWADFQRLFGGLGDLAVNYTPQAAYGFFANGGQRLYMARVVAAKEAADGGKQPPDTKPPASLLMAIPKNFTDAAPVGIHDPGDNSQVFALQFTALGKGAFGNRVWIRLSSPSGPKPADGEFILSVLYFSSDPTPTPDAAHDPLGGWAARRSAAVPDLVESFDVRFDPTEPYVAASIINGSSKVITAAIVKTASDGTLFQDAQVWKVDNAIVAIGSRLSGADDVDATPLSDDYIGADLTATGDRRGLGALESIEDVALLVVPNVTHPTLASAGGAGAGSGEGQRVESAVIEQCERLKSRFAILAVLGTRTDVTDITDNLPVPSEYAAIYYPDILVYNPTTNLADYMSPVGHIAGIYARVDDARGVYKAPANEPVRGILYTGRSPGDGPLRHPVTRGEQDVLNPRHVNAIRDFRSTQNGVLVWGARTLASDPEWRYVNVRRTFMFIEQSIEHGTRWVVFEGNYEPTWARLVRAVENFLFSIWRDGGLAGATPAEAFFVRCDRTTMTPDDIENGRLICVVGIAPVRPAEFVIFRFSQLTQQAVAA